MSVIFAAAELIGTVAFAVSGALTAIQKRMDILGVVVLSIVTAMGGGALCDVLMGCTPPRMFYRWQYILSAAGRRRCSCSSNISVVAPSASGCISSQSSCSVTPLDWGFFPLPALIWGSPPAMENIWFYASVWGL